MWTVSMLWPFKIPNNALKPCTKCLQQNEVIGSKIFLLKSRRNDHWHQISRKSSSYSWYQSNLYKKLRTVYMLVPTESPKVTYYPAHKTKKENQDGKQNLTIKERLFWDRKNAPSLGQTNSTECTLDAWIHASATPRILQVCHSIQVNQVPSPWQAL